MLLVRLESGVRKLATSQAVVVPMRYTRYSWIYIWPPLASSSLLSVIVLVQNEKVTSHNDQYTGRCADVDSGAAHGMVVGDHEWQNLAEIRVGPVAANDSCKEIKV